MTATNTIEQTNEMVNGVDVGQLMNVIGEIEADQNYAKFQFRATNQWINGSLSRSRIKGFFAGNTEGITRKEAFMLDADEPVIAAGQDSAPNSMEYVLHALATCLTGNWSTMQRCAESGFILSIRHTRETWMFVVCLA